MFKPRGNNSHGLFYNWFANNMSVERRTLMMKKTKTTLCGATEVTSWHSGPRCTKLADLLPPWQ